MKDLAWSLREARTIARLALSLFVCTDAAAQLLPKSVCPTCVSAPAAAPNAGAQQGVAASTLDCHLEEVSLTPAVEQAFHLDQLRAFFEKPNTVQGFFGNRQEKSARAESSRTSIEIKVDLGKLSYRQRTPKSGETCRDLIYAKPHIQVRVGEEELLFEADGVLWWLRNTAMAQVYASTDLAAATGSYQPELDISRVHAGIIETVLFLSPRQLRGDISVAAIYFANEAQLQRYRGGDALNSLGGFQRLRQLSFPEDQCEDHELSFARDEPIGLLHGQSADELRVRAEKLIARTPVVDAVWRDNRETRVAAQLRGPVKGTVCLMGGSEHTQVGLNTEWVLRMPVAGRLSTRDGRLDMPLDELIVGVDDVGMRGATLHAWIPTVGSSDAKIRALPAGADVLEAYAKYDFGSKPARVNGIVNFLGEADRLFHRKDCLAFPPGGERDTGDCRSR